MHSLKKLLMTCGLIIVSACVHAGSLPPIKPVAHVDLPRFMGAWYVIATIPTRFEKNAYNAVETYTMQPDGNIYTAFRFNNGSFNSTVKAIHSTAFVKTGSGNAVWGVQVFWPVKAQYVVAYLKEDYSQVIVARDARDYTWIMARTPTISQADYDALMERVKQLGYSLKDVRKVPQQGPET
ncbi:lipocalin family protein [Pinirhizobacter soli]|uniref:lipocalin family protein n=1 Tax=Pinirhizobacter soli TaxID=2786953 RepID=UPI002029F955|nr:lipocalin family protein [Pinirhizobacter soli]